ncbi:MAG: type III-B CRISPR module-associated protein Cmr5 [Chloroflexi bacterium AL-W]|nr:type III-B CRISPR module-associated protein Cmr5 [Chloroflexi bacterium AL-N1]NOK66641.1 type III-B CRISPR module-associated protein Cmr5 [Chloroflexi bacterium AL-N10]NOK72029.1 type III-B CRISPR module-associated protein Cmr5 [Chloroflexi bacterium AL-N5]NOK81286.1 type III-B CRISPR module-associated protein Cmr5 [Chloroflexi bacterium AL-W]NOK89559.1 type III-B CRISPR module-associated protein Cmr5 [Chloroflexi bacterium AL-N15]
MLTREQRYAAKVYDQICNIRDSSKSEKGFIDPKKYGALCHKLPVLIRTSGLTQALVFVQARKEQVGKQLIGDLGQTIDQPNLIDVVKKAELGPYMRLTQQALDALLWYKRFAQSELGVAHSGEEQD